MLLKLCQDCRFVSVFEGPQPSRGVTIEECTLNRDGRMSDANGASDAYLSGTAWRRATEVNACHDMLLECQLKPGPTS